MTDGSYTNHAIVMTDEREPATPDSDYDELFSIPEGEFTIHSGHDEPASLDARDGNGCRTIPFSSIHRPSYKFRDPQRRVFIPRVDIEVRITNCERNVTSHLLNPNLYTIELTHGDYTWTVKKRYKHIQNLHQQLKLYRATLNIPFPTRAHRERRQSFRQSVSGPGKRKQSLPRFPNKPDALVPFEAIDHRVEQLEEYLRNLLSIKMYRTHPDTVQFLEVSHLSFISGLGPKGKEGMILKRTGSTHVGRAGCNVCGVLDSFICVRCSHVCNDLCGTWRHRWLFVKDTYMGYLRPKDGQVKCVLLFDSGFEVSSGMYATGLHRGLQVLNLSRHLIIKCWTKRKRKEWIAYLKDVALDLARDFTLKNRHESYAPERPRTQAAWFVDGRDYMAAVADALEAAREEIFIADWWLSPEIYLKRPMLEGDRWRLDQILARKASEGVKVFVLLYKEVQMALGINSFYSKQRLVGSHHNIKVLRHPDHAKKGVFLWAHHEKIVVIDQTYAFVGGLDLCYGRWDDSKHRLTDLGSVSQTSSLRPPALRRHHTSSRPYIGSGPGTVVQLAMATNSIGLGVLHASEADLATAVAHEAVKGETPPPERRQLLRHVRETGTWVRETGTWVRSLYRSSSQSRKTISSDEEDGPEETEEGAIQPEQDKSESVFLAEPDTGSCDGDTESQGNPDSQPRETAETNLEENTMEAGQGDSVQEDNKPDVDVNTKQDVTSEGEGVENTPQGGDSEPESRGRRSKRAVQYADEHLTEITALDGTAKLWLGKDYTNFIVKDFSNLDQPYIDLVDRNSTPRMPWHDIGAMVQGAAARDIARHFIQRWNAVKLEKAKMSAAYPYLLPKSYDDVKDPKNVISPVVPGLNMYNVSCQALRSVSDWSAGFLEAEVWEESIHEAYVDAILHARHYVYIENQFFVSLAVVKGNSVVRNQVGSAICRRILRAHKEGSTFRVYVVMPLLPGFEGEVGSPHGTALHAVTHWNYASICRGRESLLGCLLEEGVPDPSRYVTFCGLRTHSLLNGDLVTELIYVHSKLLIVDDCLVICGSANINDRSLLGRRDSEIAVLIQDYEFDDSVMDGAPSLSGKFAGSLRRQLFQEHLGLLGEAEGQQSSVDLRDIVCSDFYDGVWCARAENNTSIYERVFHCLPTDSVMSFQELRKYHELTGICHNDPPAAASMLEDVKGHLVKLPLDFLSKEVLTPNAGTVEGLMPTTLWT